MLPFFGVSYTTLLRPAPLSVLCVWTLGHQWEPNGTSFPASPPRGFYGRLTSNRERRDGRGKKERGREGRKREREGRKKEGERGKEERGREREERKREREGGRGERRVKSVVVQWVSPVKIARQGLNPT